MTKKGVMSEEHTTPEFTSNMENNEDRTVVNSTLGSIQEPGKNNELPIEVSDDKTRFKFTVEPMMMFLLLGLNISMLVQTNVFEERMCLHSTLKQNKSVNCYNMTSKEQEIIQPAVANLQMIKILIETLIPSVTSLFLGPWSDINGRLPLLLSSISGVVISNCMFCVFSIIPELPPITFLLCSIPISISGGSSALFIASYSYIVDITHKDIRVFRLGVLQTFISFGSILGTLLSPILYNNSSTYAFGLSTIFIIIALLYASIFLKETIINTEGTKTKLFDINLVKDMFHTVFEKRYGYLRSIIIISAGLLTLNLAIMLGENSLMYLYLQKRFSWSLDDFTLFTSYSTILSASVPAVGLYIFSIKLKIPEMYLATAATGMSIIEKVGIAYAIKTWEFYFVKLFGCVVYTSEPLVRSQLSKILPSKDIGKIFAFISVAEGFGTLLGSPIYTIVYDATIHNFTNCIFLLSAVLITFILVLYIILLFLLSKSTKTNDDVLIQN